MPYVSYISLWMSTMTWYILVNSISLAMAHCKGCRGRVPK